MATLAELTGSALDALPEGVALADSEGRVALWSNAAESITGHSRGETVGLAVREALDLLIVGGSHRWIILTNPGSSIKHTPMQHGTLIRIRHKAGHELPVLARVTMLRDSLGGPIGTGVFFHPAETIDALPHGEQSADSKIDGSPSELEERLDALYRDFQNGGSPLGVMWVMIDQARTLRVSRGMRACEAMLEKLERTLAGGMKPAEEIGRWGDDEFLVLSHERSAAMLAAHAQVLAGLARTTEFHWWGDRLSLTVSIGAAQGEPNESLSALLERAQAAMVVSARAGGNKVTMISGRNACSPS